MNIFNNEPYETSALPMPTFIKLQVVPKCGAKKRGKAERCKAPAMKNGRCRIHGGKSTGPRTPEGLAHSRKANWKHGNRSIEAKKQQKGFVEFFKAAKVLLKELPESLFIE